MTGYINKFDEDKNKNKNKNKKRMSLKVKDKQFLKDYNKIYEKTERLMSIGFDSKTTYSDDDKYIKTKINTYEDSITTNIYNKKLSKRIPEEKIPCNFLSIIMLDSVLYAYEKHHPQTFSEECKYAQERTKTRNYIDKELKSESDTDTDNGNDTDNEE